MIANDAPHGGVATPERFLNGSMATGYRFVVTDCQTDGSSTRITVTNKGVAPIYRDAWFDIGGVRASASLKGLLPGDELRIEIPATPNADASNISIVSDYILPHQTIEFEK